VTASTAKTAGLTLFEVALPLPLHRRFTYRLEGDQTIPAPGARVVVGFGRRRLVGFAIGPVEQAPEGVRVRPILEVLDAGPVLSETEWRLAQWMARYYVAPLGLVARLFYPPGATYSVGEGAPGRAARAPERLHVLPVAELDSASEAATREALGRAPAQRRVWEAARALDAPVERSVFCDAVGVSSGVVRAVAQRGFVQVEPRPVTRDPYRTPQALTAVEEEGPLTADQVAAVAAVKRALDAPEGGQTLMLRGITGSGKTRVYVEAVDAAVSAGGRAIVLVPEIGLASPVVSRFRARFGDRLAVLHSGLSDGERHDAWRRAREGQAPIVIGARSALFAPVGRAALIVVDEEHETAYKQDETPRYLARDVAVYRAALENSVVVLGSATPALETRTNAGAGKYQPLVLSKRIADRPLPEVEIVDLTNSSEGEPGETVAPGITRRLAEALDETLGAGHQALLFLNRRGFSAFVQCLDCGWVAMCPDCRISLTYHRQPHELLCHYCAHRETMPDACHECRGRGLDTRGLGTQQVERAVAARYPEARIARMDLDTTGAKWSHARIYRAMQAREIDILVGTQMIAKGFDLPGVALVGVISADTALHLPDFRAAERTFQLLAQVAGRAGRGDQPGRVIFQTYLPDGPAIVTAAAHDYEGFYQHEIDDRQQLAYPPAARLANVVVSGSTDEAVAEAVVGVADHLRARPAAGLAVVGPAPCPLERLRGRTRHHVLLKAVSPSELERALWDLARHEQSLVGANNRLEIDRDPLNLL
jgi:primosomal protein N' (replication factor Y)